MSFNKAVSPVFKRERTEFELYTREEREILSKARDIMDSKLKSQQVNFSLAHAAEHFRHLIGFDTREHFAVMYVDFNGLIMSSEILHSGCRTSASIDINYIARRVLSSDCSGVVLSHNHPHSHIAAPSDADISTTTALKAAFDTIKVTLIDHVIVTPGSHFYSFRRDGRV